MLIQYFNSNLGLFNAKIILFLQVNPVNNQLTSFSFNCIIIVHTYSSLFWSASPLVAMGTLLAARPQTQHQILSSCAESNFCSNWYWNKLWIRSLLTLTSSTWSNIITLFERDNRTLWTVRLNWQAIHN